MWEIVDEYRTKDRDIGFLQDDFLYWKMLWILLNDNFFLGKFFIQII